MFRSLALATALLPVVAQAQESVPLALPPTAPVQSVNPAVQPTSPVVQTVNPAIAPTTAIQAAPAEPYFPQTSAAPVIDVDRIVVAGFPQYDTDGVAGLSTTEFATWMAQLFANAGLAAPDSAYLTQAFAQSDVTRDGLVEAGELTQFLRGG